MKTNCYSLLFFSLIFSANLLCMERALTVKKIDTGAGVGFPQEQALTTVCSTCSKPETLLNPLRVLDCAHRIHARCQIDFKKTTNKLCPTCNPTDIRIHNTSSEKLPTLSTQLSVAETLQIPAVQTVQTELQSAIQQHLQQEQSGYHCVICLDTQESTSSNPLQKLRCEHTFHKNCLQEWIYNSNQRSCLLCKTEIPETYRQQIVGIAMRYTPFLATQFALSWTLHKTGTYVAKSIARGIAAYYEQSNPPFYLSPRVLASSSTLLMMLFQYKVLPTASRHVLQLFERIRGRSIAEDEVALLDNVSTGLTLLSSSRHYFRQYHSHAQQEVQLSHQRNQLERFLDILQAQIDTDSQNGQADEE